MTFSNNLGVLELPSDITLDYYVVYNRNKYTAEKVTHLFFTALKEDNLDSFYREFNTWTTLAGIKTGIQFPYITAGTNDSCKILHLSLCLDLTQDIEIHEIELL